MKQPGGTVTETWTRDLKLEVAQPTPGGGGVQLPGGGERALSSARPGREAGL